MDVSEAAATTGLSELGSCVLQWGSSGTCGMGTSAPNRGAARAVVKPPA